MSKPSPVVPPVAPLTSVERYTASGRVVRALAHLPPLTQRDVLAVVADNEEMAEALYRMLSILRGLSPADRAAVVASSRTLVGVES